MTTLYRKYRPQTFSSLVGQEYIVQTLTNELLMNKLAQAYLFSGPRGTGKTTLARLLAKAVNCQNRKDDNFEPCDECSSCQEITAGRNVDVIEIDAASQTGVDNVRENIIENAQFKPTKSKYKVFIIDEVHMLSTSAFNALLKTLEEPPAYIMFILATTELHKLPATVISRCQRFQFKKIPFDLMENRLTKICTEEDIKIAPTVLQRIIAKSDGCLRDAESLLGQIFSLNVKNITEEDVSLILPVAPVESILTYTQTLADKDTKAAFDHINKLAEDGANFEQFVLQLLEVLRTMLIVQTTKETKNLVADYNEETIKTIQKLTEVFNSSELLRLIDLTLKRKQEIKSSPVPQLPLELLAVEFINLNDAITNEVRQIPDVVKKSPHSITKDESKTSIEKKQDIKTESITEFKPEPKIEVTTPSPTISPTIQTSLDHIKQEWNNVILKLSQKSASLTFVAKMSEPKNIDNEGLHITVPYDFHREKLMEGKNKKLFEEILEETFKEKIRLLCECETKQTEQPTPIIHGVDDTELGNLAAAFGGEVVS